MTANLIAIVVALVLGGLTGWLACFPFDVNVPMGILASVSVGGIGSVFGVAVIAGLGLQPHSLESWTIVLATAVLTAGWLVGTLRATMGLFSSAEGEWR